MNLRIELDREYYRSMFCLGIKTWWPGLFQKRETWKYFRIGIIIGPYLFGFTVGSASVYHETIGKHLMRKEEV